MAWQYTPTASSGILHHYAPFLAAFEYAPFSEESAAPPQLHTLLFVGGLNDGLASTPYTKPLAHALRPNWRLVQPILSSSYSGWGTSSLDKDVLQIAECINYILNIRPNGKIVLMGHSTGCQDIMQYLLSPLQKDELARPPLAGAIMQGGVSDREALGMMLPEELCESSIRLAQSYVAEGREDDVLPASSKLSMFRQPVSAKRWLALMSPGPAHDGEDDFFSSDFTYERLMKTFGRIGSTKTPIQILFGAMDQFVPGFVNREEMVGRWKKAIRDGGGIVDEDSGVVEGMDHSLSTAEDGVMEEMIGRVLRFLRRVETRA